MKRLVFIFAFLLCCSAIQVQARGIMTMCGAGTGAAAPACTTPTGDELTESFGEGSTSCWTSGSSVCNNTWTVATGSPSIANVPAGAADNTACTKGLYFDAAESLRVDLGDGTISNNVQVVINATIYIDSSSMAGYALVNLLSLNGTAGGIPSSTAYAALAITRQTSLTGSATKFRVVGASTCDIDFSEDTWYNITITLDAAGAANGSTLSDGTNSCNFTRDTDASRYVHVGASAVNVVGYIGNIRVTTP